ncbi:MAG: TlpA family protein disulfide reductase [Myxococcota bacterium]
MDGGTDPTLADTDGDGRDDGVERTAGTDPTDKWDWPQGQRWPDLSADAPSGVRQYRMGKVLPKFTLIDNTGTPVTFDQFSGYVRLIQIIRGYTDQSRDIAAAAEAEYQERRLDGFMIIQLVIEDDRRSTQVSPAFLSDWQREYGLSFPVVADSDGALLDNLVQGNLVSGFRGITLLVDADGRAHSKYSEPESTTVVYDIVDELLK